MSMMKLQTSSLIDSNLRAAAEVIDQHIGKKNNHEITLKDLQEAERLVEDAALGVGKAAETWHPDAIAVVKQNLPKLWAEFKEAEPKDTVKDKYAAILIDTIADPSVRKTARLLASRFARPRAEVSIDDIHETRKLLAEIKASKPPSNPKLAKTITDGVAAKTFDEDAFNRLATFMTTGVGGISNHGPVNISGREFADVYWLPLDLLDTQSEPVAVNVDGAEEEQEPAAASAAGADAAAQPADGEDAPAAATRRRSSRPARERSESELNSIIDEYTKRFKRTGYDCIFFLGADKRLYVALNDKGAVDKINEGFRLNFVHDSSTTDSCVVLRVVESNNSIGDATVGFWGKLVRKLGDTMNALLFRRIDKRLEQSATRVQRATKDELSTDEKHNLQRMVITGGTVAALGAAMASAGAVLGEFPLVAGSVAGIGAVMTAVQIVDYLATTRDKTAILNASGHVVNTTGPIVH